MARHHYETLQQVFDDAYRGLAAQGFQKSIRKAEFNKPMGCYYRGDEGRKCAIGHCIRDEDYTPEMEGMYAGQVPSVADVGRYEMARLQFQHDMSETPDDMKAKLEAYAKELGLTIPSIEGAA